MKLNIGCGKDKWGDIRLDVDFSYRGQGISPNFIADAHYLPFRDSVFSEVKASHIIEELPYWRKALLEWIRVCNDQLILKFPVVDGFKRPLLLGLLNLSVNEIRDAMKCRKLRCHYWIINPKIISKILKEKGFEVSIAVKSYPILQIGGRKGRLFRPFGKYKRIKIEYEIIARKRKRSVNYP